MTAQADERALAVADVRDLSELEADEDTDLAVSEETGEAAGPAALIKEDGTPTPMGWHHINARLARPMQTRSRAGKGGYQFEYITARNVQDRLDEVVGPGNWATEYVVLYHDPGRNNVVVQCTLTIFGVPKADVGTNNNPDIPEFVEAKDRNGNRITDKETGEVKMVRNSAWEQEPFKAAYSDALKRAAVAWGVGRWIYNK